MYLPTFLQLLTAFWKNENELKYFIMNKKPNLVNMKKDFGLLLITIKQQALWCNLAKNALILLTEFIRHRIDYIYGYSYFKLFSYHYMYKYMFIPLFITSLSPPFQTLCQKHTLEL